MAKRRAGLVRGRLSEAGCGSSGRPSMKVNGSAESNVSDNSADGYNILRALALICPHLNHVNRIQSGQSQKPAWVIRNIVRKRYLNFKLLHALAESRDFRRSELRLPRLTGYEEHYGHRQRTARAIDSRPEAPRPRADRCFPCFRRGPQAADDCARRNVPELAAFAQLTQNALFRQDDQGSRLRGPPSISTIARSIASISARVPVVRTCNVRPCIAF